MLGVSDVLHKPIKYGHSHQGAGNIQWKFDFGAVFGWGHLGVGCIAAGLTDITST